MFVIRKAVAAIVLTVMIPTTALASRSTDHYTSLTVFGDSLVDAGNYYIASGGSYPDEASGYYQGRNTNGYDYTDLLSMNLFGTPTTPSFAGGSNYAIGGAHAVSGGNFDLGAQLGNYENSGAGAPDPNGLFVLNFGGNDIFAAAAGNTGSYPDATSYLQAAAGQYAGLVQTLNDLGARNILITGFPLWTSPLSYQADGYLKTDLASLNLSSDTSLFYYDYNNFFARVQNDPSSVDLPVLDYNSNCIAQGAQPSCTGLFYFDGIHPTAEVQNALYHDIDKQFNLTAPSAAPEASTWMYLTIGFVAIGASLRFARRRTHTSRDTACASAIGTSAMPSGRISRGSRSAA